MPKIRTSEITLRDYANRNIDQKIAQLDQLPSLRLQKHSADQEYETLTAAYNEENQRKKQLLAQAEASWATQRQIFSERKTVLEARFSESLSQLHQERSSSLNEIEERLDRDKTTLQPKKSRLSQMRNALNAACHDHAQKRPPLEIAALEQRAATSREKQRDEIARQEKLRGELNVHRQAHAHTLVLLEGEAKGNDERLQTALNQLEAERDRLQYEIADFDSSLACFIQQQRPAQWQDAARTISRHTLFHNAAELGAKVTLHESASLWGVAISTATLREPSGHFDRDQLNIEFQKICRSVGEKKDGIIAAHEQYRYQRRDLEKQAETVSSRLQAQIVSSNESERVLSEEYIRLANDVTNLRSQFESSQKQAEEELKQRSAVLAESEAALQRDEKTLDEGSKKEKLATTEHFRTIEAQLRDDLLKQRSFLAQEEAELAEQQRLEQDRIESEFQQVLAAKGVKHSLVEEKRFKSETLRKKIEAIEGFSDEVAVYRVKKRDLIEPLPTWVMECKALLERQTTEKNRLTLLTIRHKENLVRLGRRGEELRTKEDALDADGKAVERFLNSSAFVQESGYLEREDITPAEFYILKAVETLLKNAELAHSKREDLDKRGEKAAKSFLRCFDAETLERKVLGFSPIHDYFNWFIFVGNELKPFVREQRILASKRVQTQEFEQLIRNISQKNADFQDGIRQVGQTALHVQEHIKANNFVDVINAVDLKVERVDSKLTQILAKLGEFSDVSFHDEPDIFMNRAGKEQIDRAIETFEQLLLEIDRYRDKRLRLTDYFDFSIRVTENGHDMGWKKSLDHIGSTGTDYLLKMLIYLSLIEIYREKAIDSRMPSTVHCVMDETGVLAPKYIRDVLNYACKRGIILITAGHSQQTVGFEHWIRVRKVGQRFAAQTVLRRVLRCD